MNLFLVDWGASCPELIKVASLLEKEGHKIVYWLCPNKEQVDQSLFPSAVFCDSYDVVKWPKEDGDALLWEDGLIELFRDVEPVIYAMMNRRYESMPMEQKRHFYYNLLYHWYGIMKKIGPDAVLFPIIPHSLYGFLIYKISEKLGFKNLLFLPTWSEDRVLLANKIENIDASVVSYLNQTKSSQYGLNDLDVRLKDYYFAHQDVRINNTPSIVQTYIHTYKGWKGVFLKIKIILKYIQNLRIIFLVWPYLKKKFGMNVIREYNLFKVRADYDKKFIYVPLHLQPECSTCPMGGVFDDQLLMLELLSSVLPQGWVIYVKEHPAQWLGRGINYSSYRYPGFYKEMSKIKNIKLIDINTDSYELIRYCKSVATVTGTAGWEAILRNKPVLVFGSPWYQNCDGVIKVGGSINVLRKGLEAIEGGFLPDKDKVNNYLWALDHVAIKGYTSWESKQVSVTGDTVSIENVYKALSDALK